MGLISIMNAFGFALRPARRGAADWGAVADHHEGAPNAFSPT
jgi:hypothetical protein